MALVDVTKLDEGEYEYVAYVMDEFLVTGAAPDVVAELEELIAELQAAVVKLGGGI